jgi:DNA-binding NarL/FixJ family response regulator
MAGMSNITILIADAQHLFRDGLKLLLKNKRDIEISGEAENRKELIQALQQRQPDVVIMDYNLPGYFTQKDILEIHKYAPLSKLLIISSDHDKEAIYSVLEYNINSFLTKECSKKEITRAIYATVKGEKFFCNKILDVLLEKSAFRNKLDCEPTSLSERETEVIKSIADGKSNRIISDDLCISIHTVRTHRKNIMRKLGINSVSELVLYAVNAGIIRIDR